ncbi:MAG: NAD(P)/FAD-dependent oxidoreductase [Rubrobacteraceae bacterium]
MSDRVSARADDAAYDVIIVGGSFAGLSVAMQLRGRRVLVLDQHPIGSHQMSSCGTPLPTAKAVGAEAAILEEHPALVMHAGGREMSFPLRDPFVTFDYEKFCGAMLEQTDAEVRLARVTELDGDVVETTKGPAKGRFIVDAAGWRSQRGRSLQPPRPVRRFGYGLETELPVRLDLSPGLHFYFEKDLMPNGYVWAFPCGETVRLGLGSFEEGLRLRPRLERFLERFGLRAGETRGGVLAIERSEPLAEEMFVVGDAAGQCLPVTGEGIRAAIFHGVHCGRAIASALDGELSSDEARDLYREQVRGMDRFHERLMKMQAVVARTPEPLLAAAGRILARPALTHRLMGKYLVSSGYFLG